jgi:hypothetical protein
MHYGSEGIYVTGQCAEWGYALRSHAQSLIMHHCAESITIVRESHTFFQKLGASFKGKVR